MDERSTRLAGLETFLIGAAGAAKITVVFLHGRGMKPSDLTPFAHSLGIPGAAFVFPQGPLAEAGGGFSWWSERRDTAASPGRQAGRDLADFAPPGRREARARIRDLIAAVRETGHAGPLVLAGFSQGGMLAGDTVLMEGVRVAGLVMMSASRIAIGEWSAQRRRLQDLPAFVSHGRADSDLAFEAGERLHDFLRASGAAVQWMPFDGGHEIPFPVWRQFRHFARSMMSAGSATNEKIASYGTH